MSPSVLCGRLKVGIGMFARPCARGVVCDTFGAKAALLCSILCLYWDSIPRACQALYFRVICPTAVRGEPQCGARRCKKMVLPAAICEKLQCWVALSCDAHLVPACLGRIRQPCFRSLSEWNLVRTFFEHSPFCAGNWGKKIPSFNEWRCLRCLSFCR